MSSLSQEESCPRSRRSFVTLIPAGVESWRGRAVKEASSDTSSFLSSICDISLSYSLERYPPVGLHSKPGPGEIPTLLSNDVLTFRLHFYQAQCKVTTSQLPGTVYNMNSILTTGYVDEVNTFLHWSSLKNCVYLSTCVLIRFYIRLITLHLHLVI